MFSVNVGFRRLLVTEIDEAATEVQIVNQDGCLGRAQVVTVKRAAHANVPSRDYRS